jgi:octaprenyl-diphosphate synthase
MHIRFQRARQNLNRTGGGECEGDEDDDSEGAAASNPTGASLRLTGHWPSHARACSKDVADHGVVMAAGCLHVNAHRALTHPSGGLNDLNEFQNNLNTPVNMYASLAQLRDAATVEQSGVRAAARIAEIHSVLGDDMGAVDDELRRLARDGISPSTDAATHLFDGGGKRVRPLTALLSAACFGPIPEEARDAAVVAELVHLATLLHDDVVDEGTERRGRATARMLWGNAVSVLAGDLLLTHALERTASTAPGSVLGELFETLRLLVDGEVVQLRGRTQLDLREDVYFRIVRGKTASLFAWAARAGATVAGGPPSAVAALGDFGARVGVAFQLIDDVLDYEGDPILTGKAMLGDLSEGKLTLPLIRTLAERPDLIRDVEAVRRGEAFVASRLVAAVHASDACHRVRADAREETRLALVALDAVPPSTARDMLAEIARELVERRG